MASIVSAGTTSATALNMSADTTGILQLSSNNGTVAVTVDTSQNVGIGTASPATYGKLAVAGISAFGVDQTDYIAAIGGGGTARVETVGGNTNVNLALSTKGTGSFYIWRGGYGGTNTLLIDGSSNLQFNSGYGSVATAYGCRAWVNFNGQGTVSIRASGNVSSVTDNGTGDYTLNFSTSIVDVNYSVAFSFLRDTLPLIINPFGYGTATLRFQSMQSNATFDDCSIACISIFR
jgi:hypothetical protein